VDKGDEMTMREKGFTISISTILLVITIVWFSVFYAGFAQRQEANIYSSYAIEKAGFVADDITEDVSSILGTDVNVNKGPNFTTIVFADKLPGDINKLQLVDYNQFVDVNYSTRQNASIDLDFTRLLDGKAEMLFSNGLVYEHAYSLDQNFVQFSKGNGGNTGVFTYDIGIYATVGRLDLATPWACDSTGDVNVSLRYSDSYGETSQTLNCKQDSSSLYTYTFTFLDSGGSLTVYFGSFGGLGNSVIIRRGIENPLIAVETLILAELPSPSQELVWYYDADLNYMQQDVNLSRKIELGRA